MGDCSYCEKKAGWAKSVHKECKIEHYESSFKRLDSGVGLKASAGEVTSTARENFVMTDLMGPDLEVLEANFPKSGGESWLWMQPEVTVYLVNPEKQILPDDTIETAITRPYTDCEEYKHCLLGISDEAVHILVSKKPMRWALSEVAKVSFNKAGNNKAFQVNMAESVPGQSDAFIVSLGTDGDFARIYADWVNSLVGGASDQASDQASGQAPDQASGQAPDQAPAQAPDQAPDQAPTQAPTQAQVTSVDPSTDVLIQDLLAKGKEQLINGDFGAAAKSVKAVIALDKDNADAISILKAAESTDDSESKQVASPPDAQVETENDQDEFNPRSLCAWVKAIFGIIVIIIIVFWFFGDCSGDESESGDTEQSQERVDESESGDTEQSQERVYEGCDGLEDLIPKLKSVGGSSLSLYQAVNAGSEAACNRLIEGWNKPKNLKD